MKGLRKINLTVVIMTVVTFAWAGYLAANSGGRTGVCAETDGCSCHGDMPDGNGNVTVTLTGPQEVLIGSTSMYTISVSGGPSGTTGGFNLCASGGTLIADTETELGNGELTHTNGDNRSWTFEWTAPGTETGVSFNAIAMSTNGSGTGGDSWNWYGGAAGANFDITVSATVPAQPLTWGMLKQHYRPVLMP